MAQRAATNVTIQPFMLKALEFILVMTFSMKKRCCRTSCEKLLSGSFAMLRKISIFVVRKGTILIRRIYMVVFERIFSGWFSERFCSSWKFSRRVFRSSGSGDGRVNVREDVSVRLRSVSLKFCRFL